MFEDERVIQKVALWVEKAENDLRNAGHTLKIKQKCPTDTVCFHAQQCVEKYLKALLVWREVEFPRAHDITHLLKRLAPRDQPDLTPDECEQLTDYATVNRYPGDYPPITLQEARQAVKIARRVRKQIRARLPKQALRLK